MTSCWSIAAAPARGGPRAARLRAAIRPAIPARTSPTSRPSSPPTTWAPTAAPHGRALDPATVQAYMGHVRRTRPARSAPRSPACAHSGHERRFEVAHGRRQQGRVQSTSTPDPQRPGRLHGHQPAATQQLQRTARGLPGRGAVCVSYPGRRRDPAQRGLPRPDRADRARGLHAQPALPRRGRGRQRRDLAGRASTRSMGRSGSWPPRRAR